MLEQFNDKVEAALAQLREVLDNAKKPMAASKVQHSYADKFSLTEGVLSTSVAAVFTCLEAMGLDAEGLDKARGWAGKRTVTLLLSGEERCIFSRKTERQEVDTEHSTTFIGSITSRLTGQRVRKIVEYFWQVDFTGKLELVAGSLSSRRSERLLLRSWVGKVEEVTLVEDSPRPKVRELPILHVDITWLLQHVSASHKVSFSIDREAEDCRTPRRNVEVDAAMATVESIQNWAHAVVGQLKKKSVKVADMDTQSFLDQSEILMPVMPLFEDMSEEEFSDEKTDEEETSEQKKESSRSTLTVGQEAQEDAGSGKTRSRSPSKTSHSKRTTTSKSKSRERKSPRHEEKSPRRDGRSPRSGKSPRSSSSKSPSRRRSSSNEASKGSVAAIALQHGDQLVEYGYQRRQAPLLSSRHVNKFLREHKRGLVRNARTVLKVVPAVKCLLTVPEALLLAAATQLQTVLECTKDGVSYVEAMLFDQLEAAAGKAINEKDFAEFVPFFQRKLFVEQYAPLPFSYSVRRANHTPEGHVSIEFGSEAITSFVASTDVDGTVTPMQLPISAGTSLAFLGERRVHAHIRHQFASCRDSSLTLRARARQFSCFVIVVGKIVSSTVFEPTAAMLVQNKDDVEFMLKLESLPTPKEFRDAVGSLSPEQKSFAKAYRAMQLENTLFALLLVDVKPQLEKVLNLAEDSLTKEIRLTQDLIELLSVYQIPTSMLAFDEANDVAAAGAEMSAAERVAIVKANVAPMLEMIGSMKANDIGNKKKHAAITDELHVMLAQGVGGPTPPEPYETAAPDVVEPSTIDFTQLPKLLENRCSLLEEDCLRPTIVSLCGSPWIRYRSASLLAESRKEHMSEAGKEEETKAGFDLLDALTRSGELPMEHTALHVVLASTYAFTSSLIDTIIKDNINPIDKLERAMLLVATTVLRKSPEELLHQSLLPEITARHPTLFLQRS